MSDNNQTTVVIIGAGVAGLAAAKELAINNIPFILVEAQDYLGGRVRNINAEPDLPIDLGAQYVLGDKGNVVYDICKELNCILEPDEKEDLYVFPDGSRPDKELIEQVWGIREEILEDAKLKSRSAADKLNISLFQHLKENYAQRLTNDVIQDDSLRKALVAWLIKLEEVDIGCQNLGDVNLAQCDNSEQLEKASLWKLRNGFRTLIDDISSAIPRQQIQLNTEATKVQFIDNNHKLNVELTSVIDATKSSLSCDHVIWTTSLGYLKKNFNTVFASESKLILQKQNAIKNLGFGTANKLILLYDEPICFWPENTADLHPLGLNSAGVDLFSDEDLVFLKKHNVDPVQALSVLDGVLCVSSSISMRFVIVWIVGEAAVTAENFNEILLTYLGHNLLCRYLKAANNSPRPSRAIM